MAQRINSMRSKLRETLESLGSTRSWDHVTKQIGMFAYSGMSKEEVTALREKHHIYCTLDGRISMAVSFISSIVDDFNLFSFIKIRLSCFLCSVLHRIMSSTLHVPFMI